MSTALDTPPTQPLSPTYADLLRLNALLQDQLTKALEIIASQQAALQLQKGGAQ